MSENFWTITNPAGGAPVSLASLGLSLPQINFRVMTVSTASMTAHRDFDSTDDWWAFDAVVTIYRDTDPYFTGRVQEYPDSASGDSEVRSLVLCDAWQDLEEIIYREVWAIGLGTFLYPRCVLGRDSAGEPITTGEQIEEVIDYAITQGVAIQKGTIATGFQLWPSESRNQSCESIIIDELRFHPDWVAWLDHSTEPPTFHAQPKSALTAFTIDIADEAVESQSYAEVQRTTPLGVSIIYESADTIADDVFRTIYLDEAGDTSGRRVIRAMFDLEGLDVQFQKSRIETRDLPTDAEEMTAWMKLKYPELEAIPDGAFSFGNVDFMLAPEGTQPDPVNAIAMRIAKAAADELPRELVRGSIEDWMRVKVGRVIITYDLAFIIGATPPTAAQRKILKQFTGTKKTISVTATNATTKLYKGISSWTAGAGRPAGLAASILAAATEPQWEGQVTTAHEEIPAGRWHGKKLTLANDGDSIFAGAVIHSASVDVESGMLSLDFGPMPYLSAGDFLDLQRILNSRPVKWFSVEERTSNTLGAPASGSSNGDNVGPFDVPDTITPPGGSVILPLTVSITEEDPDIKLEVSAGAYQVGATGEWVYIPATAATVGTHVHFAIEQDVARAVTSAEIVIGTDVLDPVVVVGAVTTSNILIYDGTQRRHGNFTLGLWQLDGDVVRWPETIVGETPDPPPPPPP